MDTLWIFNPENDIALGNNLRRFTPPRNAMLLRERGAMLPAWIAGDGDIICTSNPTDAKWLRDMAPILKKDIEILTTENIGRVKCVRPWGWSHAIANSLQRAGIPVGLMPDAEAIERIRLLSHRRSSVIINRRLKDAGIDVSIPVEISDTALLTEYIGRHKSVVIKSPWSSSGRGVIYSDRMNASALLRHAEGTIKSQGSVLVEPRLDKIVDFAMLFEISEGNARYVGLSVFETLSGGNYTGNIIASKQYLSAIITQYVAPSCLERIRQSLETILTDLIGNTYTGICGIDMMVYKDSTDCYRIAPCIELNLRYTMGYVAHCLARDIIAPGTVAKMHVTYTGNTPPSKNGTTFSPQFSSSNRLTNGTLPLIPSNQDFTITLTVE